MEIITEKKDYFSIVRLKGRVVRENQGNLRKALEEIVNAHTKGIALDFEAVDYLDSSGLGCCAAVHKLMSDKKSGSLVMFGASPNILEMWRLIKLDLVIPVLTGEKEALARLKKGSTPAAGA